MDRAEAHGALQRQERGQIRHALVKDGVGSELRGGIGNGLHLEVTNVLDYKQVSKVVLLYT